MKLKHKHHQRLQFQHVSENTGVPREGFICEKPSDSDTLERWSDFTFSFDYVQD